MKWKNKNIVEIKDNSKLSTIEFEFAMWASFVEIENCFCAFQQIKKNGSSFGWTSAHLLNLWAALKLNWQSIVPRRTRLEDTQDSRAHKQCGQFTWPGIDRMCVSIPVCSTMKRTLCCFYCYRWKWKIVPLLHIKTMGQRTWNQFQTF